MRDLISGISIAISLIIAGCSQGSVIPFAVDSETGTFTYAVGEQPSVPILMRLNGKAILMNCFLFHEKESLVCINSLGELDFISVFKGYPEAGSVSVSFQNAGKENQEIQGFQILTIRPDPDMEYDISINNDTPWSFCQDRRGDTLIYTLRIYGTPVILLPGEKMELPRLNLINRVTGNTVWFSCF